MKTRREVSKNKKTTDRWQAIYFVGPVLKFVGVPYSMLLLWSSNRGAWRSLINTVQRNRPRKYYGWHPDCPVPLVMKINNVRFCDDGTRTI